MSIQHWKCTVICTSNRYKQPNCLAFSFFLHLLFLPAHLHIYYHCYHRIIVIQHLFTHLHLLVMMIICRNKPQKILIEFFFLFFFFFAFSSSLLILTVSAKHINRGVEGSPPPPPSYPSLPLPSSSAKKGLNQSNLKVLNYSDRRGLKWTFSFISLHRELHSLLFISCMCEWSKQIRKEKN